MGATMARKPKRRANGEGSIYEDPKGSGKWKAQITLADGTPKTKRASSQRDALEKLQQLRALREQGVRLGQKQPTVSAWCATWLEHYTRNLKPNIRADYQGVVHRYIDGDALGRARLDRLRPAQVQAWADRLAERVAPQTVRNAHARLHKALEVAVKHSYIARNPAADTDLPEVRTPPIRPLEEHQVRTFFAQLAGHRWAALYHLAVHLGMRQGELLGLTWDMVDFRQGVIHVAQQLRRVPTGKAERGERYTFALQTTKTASADRRLDVDGATLDMLRLHRANQAEERELLGRRWHDPFTARGGLVFTSETGAPVHASNMVKHFKGVLAAAELPTSTRFHDLRHTCATLLLDDGAPITAVAEILGHGSSAITANTYAHALKATKARALASLADRLKRAQ